MKIHVLLNALDYGDAVSSHCISLKRRCHELHIEASIYAQHVHDQVSEHTSPLASLLNESSPNDVLFHQFFNETSLISHVEKFPGRRVLMYHNITPPSFLPENNPVSRSCSHGLRQLGSLTHLYDHAVAMSEFSRSDLEQLGYPNTSVFPLLVDIDELRKRPANPIILAQPKLAYPVFLFVGRIAPNKRIDDLLHFVAAYRRESPGCCLLLVGDEDQHPDYISRLRRLMKQLSLVPGVDVIFKGKVPNDHLVAYFRVADAYISLSEHEGFGAPLVESMAFGLPTFAYAAGACEETMGGAGIVFGEKDWPAMAAKVREVIEDPPQREGILASQQRRLEDFSTENQQHQLQQLLEHVCSLPRREPVAKKVSVVINTYNRCERLRRCLGTLQDQTYRNFEVVVVNGPSTDATAAMLARFGGKIRVVETGRRVISVSRNAGILHAAGELVAFIDDDAVAHPKWLEELVAAFDNAEVGAAGGLVYRMNGLEIEFRNGVLDRLGSVRWDEPQPGVHWDWEEGYINTVSGNNCMFRRSALEEIGGFDEEIEYYHDEADVVMRLQATGFRTVHRPDAIVYHEAARSHIRSSAYHLDWFTITKNTLYCSLKNYGGELSKWRRAWKIARRVVSQRMRPMFRWWMERRISIFSLVRMQLMCIQGIGIGLRKGLRPSPLYQDLSAIRADAPLVQYAASPGTSMSICLLTQSSPGESCGGIVTYTIALAKALRELNCEVHIVTRGPYARSDLRDGIWYHCATEFPLDEWVLEGRDYPTAAKNLSYSNGVRRKILDIEARWGLDLIESPNWDVEGLLTAMDQRFPLVVRAHTPLSEVIKTQGWQQTEDLRLCGLMEGLLFKHATAISGSTRAILHLTKSLFGNDSKAGKLIPLGIEEPPRSASHDRLQGRKTVLFVGRLERRKGIHTLLSTIPGVLASFDDVQFEIVGEDRDAGNGSSWSQQWLQGCKDFNRSRVRFHGEASEQELNRLYEECDIFVAPSLYESCGLIYLEAMAHGKPVIGCLAGGVPEVVSDGHTGLLVPPNDPLSLENAILKLLRDDDLRQRLGRAGYECYSQAYTAEIMGAQTLRFYREVLNSWSAEREVVWRATAVELQRGPGSKIVWIPETSRSYLVAELHADDAAAYGPYLSLEPGLYRAEFKLWIGSVPKPATRLGDVDIFSLKTGSYGKRDIMSEDFSTGAGNVFDIYFTVPEPSPDDFEFRVHPMGHVPLYTREIVVRRWPTPGADQRGSEHTFRIPGSADSAVVGDSS